VFTAWYGLCILIKSRLIFVFKAVQYLPRLDFGFPTRRHKFDLESVDVRFVVNKVALGQALSPCQYRPTNASHRSSIILRLLEGRTGEAWEPPRKQCAFGNLGALDENMFLLIFLIIKSTSCTNFSNLFLE
jgi:hypothetical protein